MASSSRHTTRKPLSLGQVLKVFNDLMDSDDLTVAIVGGTLVERYLEKAITNRLVKMNEKRRNGLFVRGPLQNFEPRMKMAYALGILGEGGYAELDAIREIRNIFAHSLHKITFSTKQVRTLANKLTFHTKNHDPSTTPFLEKVYASKGARARKKYLISCLMLWVLLLGVQRVRPPAERRKIRKNYLR